MEFYPVWLPEAAYPEYQVSAFNTNRAQDTAGKHYAVAQFDRVYTLPRRAVSAAFTVAADAFFYCHVNGAFVGLGPMSAGGDFLSTGPLDWAFENAYEVPLDSDQCRFEFTVRLQPEALTEYSQGHGCLWVRGAFTLDDGSTLPFGTDEDWLCRRDTRYTDPRAYDASAPEDEWTRAARTEYNCRLERAAIPNLAFEDIRPRDGTYIFDRIYSGYIRLTADRACAVDVGVCELPGQTHSRLKLTLKAGETFTSLSMYSVGALEISATDGAVISAALWFSHYPVKQTGVCRTSDAGLDRVIDVCRHTLKMCRQTIHLDSPRHQELLACTGDYYIEMLMTLFESGDMRLADADVRRTAMWLTQNGGRMFHTTYSLIWVQMLRKLYEFTGNPETIEYCLPALRLLLDRFRAYTGENGVIDDPPDYMFVDWTVLEGYSMHHPPKALGQTVLNCFYYKALTDAAYLYETTGADGTALRTRAAQLREAFNRCFWDADRGLYIDGLDTYQAELRPWRPENPRGLKHFSRYPQALAALYGLCPEEEAARLAAVSAEDGNGLAPIQPYFMHFVLEAVIRTGLADRYALPLLRKWVPMCADCPQGLQEGWIKPQADYHFDHSHAWGGTPAYHLPMLLTGLEILEPGLKKLRLRPRLYGLESADISLPTPYGSVEVRQKKGRAPEISAPDCIEIIT